MDAIVVKEFSKNYGKISAVHKVSFTVKAGEIFGLIGPDGAGKTTIIRTIVSLLHVDEGEIWLQGKEVSKNPEFVRTHIGYMPQRFSLYSDLTVDENLNFFGELFGVSGQQLKKRKQELYAFSKLAPFSNRRAAALSGGMKQKLALSCMLIHQPNTIVLDEPTFGVDPVSRSEFWDILKNLAQQQTAILVSTAYMEEAGLCDRIGLIYGGNTLAIDSPEHLIRQFTDSLYLIRTDLPNITYEQLAKIFPKVDVNLFGDGIHLTKSKNSDKAELEKKLRMNKIRFSGLQNIKPTLEDLFLKLMR